MFIRLQKAIADTGYSSRRKAEELIFEGRVYINEKKASIGDKISERDQIFIDGKKLKRVACARSARSEISC